MAKVVDLTTYSNGKVIRKDETKYGLVHLDAEALRVTWPAIIKPGLLVVKSKDRHCGEWHPAHVRQAIEAGFKGVIFCECHLIVSVDSTKPVGFVVLQVENDPFISVPTSLFVWIAYCTEPRAMGCVLPVIEKRARDLGLSKVSGVSSRMGWSKRLVRYGYSAERIVYSKEIV